MDENPKRIKKKDDPYTIKRVENDYIVCFKDGLGVFQEIHVTKEVYRIFDEYELQDKKEMNEYYRHIEHSEIYENNLVKRAKEKTISLEDEFIKKATFEDLKKSMNKLKEPYKRRIKLYYFEDKNEAEIAELEGITQQAVSKSLNFAIEKLKNFLRNFQN